MIFLYRYAMVNNRGQSKNYQVLLMGFYADPKFTNLLTLVLL